MITTPVTFDVNVFVAAVAHGFDEFHHWPSPPPARGNAAANAVGVVNDAREFVLWISPHILRNVVTALVAPDGFGWDLEDAKEYAEVLVEIADASGGGVVDPAPGIDDCPDCEDNRILECALDSGSMLIVTNDVDLTQTSPWRGIPIATVADFVGRVDAARRARRR